MIPIAILIVDIYIVEYYVNVKCMKRSIILNVHQIRSMKNILQCVYLNSQSSLLTQ